MVTGRIHSIETCGTVDGPGIRYVVFMQGCPLRCAYCHNPDTWDGKCGKVVTVKEIIEDIKRYIPYMKLSKGGVTVTGGEPLLQIKFVTELFKELKKIDFHTAIDTSGYVDIEEIKELIEYTDLFLLDIKHINDIEHKKLTGVTNQKTQKLAKYLSDRGIPVWIRHVIIPGITDDIEEVKALAEFILTLKNVEKVEILPYHKMGEYKYEALNIPYRLKGIRTPDKDTIEKIKNVFKDLNIYAV